jgi:hypothetical protein
MDDFMAQRVESFVEHLYERTHFIAGEVDVHTALLPARTGELFGAGGFG